MAYAFVQQKEASNASAVATLATGNFTSPVTAGNLLLVAVTCGSGATQNTPTDTLGHTYVLIDSIQEAGTGTFTALYYAKNCLGGTNSVTTTTGGVAAASIGVFATEWSGFDTVAPLDVHQALATSSGGSGANIITSGAGVSNTSAAGSGIIGFGHDLQGPIEAAGTSPIAFTGRVTGWTSGGSAVARFEDARLTSTGSRKATFQDTGFDRHNCLMAVFLEGSATVTPSTGRQNVPGPGISPNRINVRQLRATDVPALTAPLSLAITNGALTLAGQSMSFTINEALSAGALSAAGQSVAFTLNEALSAGAVTLAGQSTTFAINEALGAGALTLAGQSTTFTLNEALSAGVATLAGQSATFTINEALTNGALTIDGQSITLAAAINLSISIGDGALSLTGQSITLAISAPTVQSTNSGGYFDFLDAHSARERARRKRELEEAERAREIADALDREIARLLHEQEAKAEETREIARLTQMAAAFADREAQEAHSQRVIKAIARVQAQHSADALDALARALRAQAEEEEFAVLMALALDD